MADSFAVVGTYELDTSQFEAKVDEVTAGYAEMDAASKAAAKGTQQLSGSVGSLADKFGVLAEEEKRAAEASKSLSTETQKSTGFFARAGQAAKEFAQGARDGFKQVVSEFGGVRGVLGQLATSFKNFATGSTGAVKLTGQSIDSLRARLELLQQKKGSLIDPKAIGQTNKQIQSVEKQITSLSNSSTSRFGAAFGSIKQSIGGVVGQIPLIGGLATALGPVGIAAAAVAGGLFKVITNTDAGATALQGLGKTGGAVFDRVTGLVVRFFDTLTSGTGVIGTAFEFITDAVDVFINKLTPIGAIFKAISETSLFQALKEDFEFGQQIANQLDELDDKQRGVNLTVAENEIGIRKNLAALRDTTKSAEERLLIADEITKVENENLAAKKELLKTELAILQAQATRQQSLKGEVDDSLKQQITDINIALANAEAESVSLTERVATRRAGIVEQEEQRKAAIRQKGIEAQKKREAEALKLAEQRAQAEAKLNDIVNGIAEESLSRRQTEAEREVEAIEKKYADLEAATLEGIAKLRAASPENAQSEITLREAQAIVAIETAKNEELAALDKQRLEEQSKTQEEAIESLRVFLLSETDQQRDAIQKRLEEQITLAEANIENIEQQNATILALTQAAEEELTKVISDEEQKRIAASEEAAAQRRALEEQNIATLAGFAEQGIAVIAGAAAKGEEVSKEAQKQLIVLLLDTLEKIIIANAVQAQAISAGSPDPANVASGGTLGIIRGILVAALIRSLFGVAKAAIIGNYEGDSYVGGDGSKPQWSGRDGFLRRLDKGERVVTRKANERHYDALEAIEGGKLDQWVMENYLPRMEALGINDDDRIVQYVQTDMGQRMAASSTLPKFFDKGIVEASNNMRKEQRSTNELLGILVDQNRRKTSSRYY